MPRNIVAQIRLKAKAAYQSVARAGIRHSIEYVDDGTYFRIRPRLEYGVRCFDNGNKRHADAPIFQWACHGQHNQQWSAWSSSGGTFNIRNRQSGMCVYRSGKDGKLYQANCNARDGRQRFKLIR